MVLQYSEQPCEEIFSSKEFLNCIEEHYSNYRFHKRRRGLSVIKPMPRSKIS